MITSASTIFAALIAFKQAFAQQSTFWSGPFIALPYNTTVEPLDFPLSLGIQYPRPLCGTTRVIQFQYEIPEDGLYTFSAADPKATCKDPVMILRDNDLEDWNWCYYTLYDKRPEVTDTYRNGTLVYIAVGGFENKCDENSTVSIAVTFRQDEYEMGGNNNGSATDAPSPEYETTSTPSLPGPPGEGTSDAPTTTLTTESPTIVDGSSSAPSTVVGNSPTTVAPSVGTSPSPSESASPTKSRAPTRRGMN
jgi:hypothetical protein